MRCSLCPVITISNLIRFKIKWCVDINFGISSHSICPFCKIKIEYSHDVYPELYGIFECPNCSNKTLITDISIVDGGRLELEIVRLTGSKGQKR
jgi:uncharacterized protein (DUF2225 family)